MNLFSKPMFVNLISKPLIALSIACGLLALGIGTASGQTNLNFEDWSEVTAGVEDPDGWSTLNYFVLLGTPQTTWKDTVDPGEGLASVRLETVYWNGGIGSPDVVGGMLSIGGPIIQSNLGISYSNRPISVDFMYKSHPFTGDTGIVLIQLTHRDTTIDSTIVVGVGLMIFSDSISSWTLANVSIDYFSSYTPDTLKIFASSSGKTLSDIEVGVNLGSAVIGSELYLDAFVINLPVGIEEEGIGTMMEFYPNPVSGFALIDFKENSESPTLIIISDLAGRQISVHHLGNGQDQLKINVESLDNGLYFAALYSPEGIVNSLRFIVSK